jgi:magnesium-transporting ATPase (P-type)
MATPTCAALFGTQDIALALVQGLLVLACVGLAYAWAKGWVNGGASPALSEEETRAMVFVTLVLGYAALIVVNRAQPGQLWASLRVPNPSAWGVILLAWGLVMVGMYWPWLAMPLKFAPLQHGPWTVALACGVLSLLAMSGLHWLLAQRQTRSLEMKKP